MCSGKEFLKSCKVKTSKIYDDLKKPLISSINSKKRVYFISLTLVLITIAFEYFAWDQQFNNYTFVEKDLNPLAQKAIDLIVQLNTFLLTLAAALFALLGLINNSKPKNEFTIYLMILSATMISVSFFFGYKSIYEILNQISQNHIALTPKSSEAIMYLSKEFYHFLAALGLAGLSYLNQYWENE